MTFARQRYSWLFVGPLAVFLLAFIVLPLLNILVLSFYTYSPTKIFVPEFTTENYTRLASTTFPATLLRTIRIGLITTAICVVLGYPLAYALARSEPRAKAIGMFLLIIPLMVSAVIRTFGWIVILGRRGIVNNALDALGFGTFPLLYNEAAVIVGLCSVLLPFMVTPLIGSIERIHPALEEAARNLGASWVGMFRRVVLPLSLPGLFSGTLLVFSTAISAIVTPTLMGGARINVLGKLIFDQLLISFQWPSASAITVLFVIATVGLSYAAVVLRHDERRERAG